MTKRIYIAGPISGYDLAERRDAFAAAAERLRRAGFDPVNPFDVMPTTEGATWLDYMRGDIKALVDCDYVATLPESGASRGAQVEITLAMGLGLAVLELDAWLS